MFIRYTFYIDESQLDLAKENADIRGVSVATELRQTLDYALPKRNKYYKKKSAPLDKGTSPILHQNDITLTSNCNQNNGDEVAEETFADIFADI